MRHPGMYLVVLATTLLGGCGKAASDASPQPAPAAAPAATTDSAASSPPVEPSAEPAQDPTVPEFPAIPTIVVPDIVGVTPAQRALEASLRGILQPVAGVTVTAARCEGEVLRNDAGLTSVDAQGNLIRNGDDGLFLIKADGSGTANFDGGLIIVNADGSGTINSDRDGLIEVAADGSGTYNGTHGLISLDGKGAGTWNGDSGLIDNHGDGGGTWNGPQGLVTINNDGSGTWNGPDEMVINHGDGTGTVGTPGRTVKMPPIPKVPPAGRFPPLTKFAPPGAPCGYLITLNDRVLFDFDKSDIRPDAAHVLDVLGAALVKVQARALEVRGHTDSKGADAYNQALSERRADAVLGALQQRGLAKPASAQGYGETQPVAPNSIQGQDNPGGRQLNRRVEIFIRT